MQYVHTSCGVYPIWNERERTKGGSLRWKVAQQICGWSVAVLWTLLLIPVLFRPGTPGQTSWISQGDARSRVAESVSETILRCAEKKDPYTPVDFWRDRNDLIALRTIIEEATGVKYDNVSQKALESLHSRAERQAIKSGFVPYFAFQQAEIDVGKPALHKMWEEEAAKNRTVMGGGFASVYATMVPVCMLFCLIKIPLAGRSIAKELLCWPWRIPLYSLAGIFGVLAYLRVEPRVTARYLKFRVWYMVSNRRLRLYWEEKEELWRIAGSPEQNIQTVVESVAAAREAALLRGRRFVFASSLLAMLWSPLTARALDLFRLFSQSSQQVQVEEKRKLSLSGNAVFSVTDSAGTGVDNVRVIFQCSDGKASAKFWGDFRKDPILQEAWLEYSFHGAASVKAGQQGLPLIFYLPPPWNSRTIETPLDPLIAEFIDRGVLLCGGWQPVSYMAGVFNGAGKADDNNRSRNACVRLSLSPGPLKLNWAWEGGRQPESYRATWVSDFVLSDTAFGMRHEIYGAYLRRINLDKDGWFLGWVVESDPRTSWLVQYLHRAGGVKEFTLGADIFPAEGLKVRPNVTIPVNKRPRAALNFQYSF